MKKAYNYRSKITHGAPIDPKKFPELVELAVACDDLLRRSLRRILTDVELRAVFSSDDKLEAFFLNRIVGNAG